MTWLRGIGAFIAGLAVAFGMVVAVEAWSAVVHPFPSGVDQTDFEVCAAHVARYPHWVLAVVVVAWAGTVFAGVWIATWLGGPAYPVPGVAVGLLLVAATAFNMYLLPYHLWFEIAEYLTLPAAAYLGLRVGHRPSVDLAD